MERKSPFEGYKSPGTEQESGSREGSSNRRGIITLTDAIHEIAKQNARAPLDTNEKLDLYLRSWWSKTYNRPLKDPLLASYSLEELLYEFYDRVERNRAEEERSDKVSDRIEEERFQDNLDWAEQEEKKELEALKKRKEKEELDKKIADSAMSPLEDEDNIKWMEEQVQKEIEQGKELYGDDFGNDIEEEF